MPHPNAELLTRFYEAFQRRDAAAMGACYRPDVTFSDPVFVGLVGDEARAMWAMLCEHGGDLELTFSGVEADDASGRAHWDAVYTFRTGRKVHNSIDGAFTFRDGLIASHVDTFDLYKWTRMALGLPGVLLGWTPLLQGKVRSMARKGLDHHMAKAEA